MIVAFAMGVVPGIISGLSKAGTSKIIVNISFPSTILSFITAMLIVLLLAPAAITAVCVVELKSTLPGQ